MDCSDPIIAVSSPPGRSLRGLIRISAENLSTFVHAAFTPPPAARSLQPSRLMLPALKAANRSLSLPCLVLLLPGPSSFTGQDIVEIQVPGNPALLNRLTRHLLSLLRNERPDARLAEPGEFAQRAFLAGRIDLTRAEGIAATIGALSDAQLQAARLLRTGMLGQFSIEVVQQLAQMLALVEAGIDFVDQDDVVPIGPRTLDEGLSTIESRLAGLLSRSRSWSSLEAIPWVVLIGRPNAGKSTLFNALLARERAIVSRIAGTTRDILCEPLRLRSGPVDAEVMLVDVAGLDEGPCTPLDRSMQRAAQDAIDRAELLLWVQPPDDPSPPPDFVASRALIVQSKADLAPPDDSQSLAVSAVTGQGLEQLRAAIAQCVGQRAVSLSSQMLALTPRHQDELTAAQRAIARTRSHLAHHLDDDALPEMELIADAMRLALDHLAALGGQMTPDDVLGKIFATFCVGK